METTVTWSIDGNHGIPRMDCDYCEDRINPFQINIGDVDDATNPEANPSCAGKVYNFAKGQSTMDIDCNGKKGQYVTVWLKGTGRSLAFCELTVKSLVQGLECNTNIDNTFYTSGNTYMLMCPACDGSGK